VTVIDDFKVSGKNKGEFSWPEEFHSDATSTVISPPHLQRREKIGKEILSFISQKCFNCLFRVKCNVILDNCSKNSSSGDVSSRNMSIVSRCFSSKDSLSFFSDRSTSESLLGKWIDGVTKNLFFFFSNPQLNGLNDDCFSSILLASKMNESSLAALQQVFEDHPLILPLADLSPFLLGQSPSSSRPRQDPGDRFDCSPK
jgi:hypothetical protein